MVGRTSEVRKQLKIMFGETYHSLHRQGPAAEASLTIRLAVTKYSQCAMARMLQGPDEQTVVDTTPLISSSSEVPGLQYATKLCSYSYGDFSIETRYCEVCLHLMTHCKCSPPTNPEDYSNQSPSDHNVQGCHNEAGVTSTAGLQCSDQARDPDEPKVISDDTDPLYPWSIPYQIPTLPTLSPPPNNPEPRPPISLGSIPTCALVNTPEQRPLNDRLADQRSLGSISTRAMSMVRSVARMSEADSLLSSSERTSAARLKYRKPKQSRYGKVQNLLHLLMWLHPSQLSSSELEIFEELVGKEMFSADDQLCNFRSPAILQRYCHDGLIRSFLKPSRGLLGFNSNWATCRICGFSGEHYRAATCIPSIECEKPWRVNLRDRDGNTPLHYLSSRGSWSRPILEDCKFLVANGASLMIGNAANQTFLHLLNCENLGSKMEHLRPLIEYVREAEPKFDFDGQDASGHTIWYRLWRQNPHAHRDALENILRLAGSAVYLQDNTGESLYLHLQQDLALAERELLRRTFNPPSRIELDFQALVNSGPHMCRDYILKLETPKSVNSYDKHGDTLLHSIIKFGADLRYCVPNKLTWHKLIRELINKGAFVNQRDRLGKMALCLATCQGYPEIVEILLLLGASYRVLAQYAVGLLDSARNCLGQAERKEDPNAVNIIRCMVIIVDYVIQNEGL